MDAVIEDAWSGGSTAPVAAPASRRPPLLALVEAIDRDGQVRQAWRIEHWPVTIGRAIDNDVVLTDPHVAAHHATIDAVPAEGGGGGGIVPAQLSVRAGQTRNGLLVGGHRLVDGQAHAFADPGQDLELQVGRTTLRLRLGAHALAPELALAPIVGQAQRWLPTASLTLALVAVVVFNTWLHADPDGFDRAAGNTVLTVLSGAAIWCGLWALLSKTFTRRGSFGWHARVFALASLVVLGIAGLAPVLAFAFSAPWVTDFSFVAVYAVFAAALYFHLLAVEPARRRLMGGIVAAGFVSGVAVAVWFNIQRTARPGEELYMSHLLPPGMRVARPVGVDAFVNGLAPMQGVLDRQARDSDGGEADDATGHSDDEEPK